MHHNNKTAANTTRRSTLLATALAGAIAALLPAATHAQAWPSRPLKIIVNNAPGGGVDVIARVIAQPLQEALGQPVVIENKGGAGGMLGGEVTAAAAPDGYTLLATAGSMVAIGPHLYRKMNFDPAKLVPLAAAGRATLFLVTRPEAPAKNVDQLVKYLKAHPGKLSFWSAGNGSSLHLAGEMMKRMTGTYAVHVPYRGASPAVQDMLAGQADFMFDSGTSLEQVKAGKLNLLAVGNQQRATLYTDVPTMQEAGLQGFDAGSTYGFFAPPGTPPDIVARLNREINKVLATKAVRDRLLAIGAEASPMSPAEFAALTDADSRRYGAIIRERKITLE